MTASFKVSYEKTYWNDKKGKWLKVTKIDKNWHKGQQMMLPFQENKSYQIVQIKFRQIILKMPKLAKLAFKAFGNLKHDFEFEFSRQNIV